MIALCNISIFVIVGNIGVVTNTMVEGRVLSETRRDYVLDIHESMDNMSDFDLKRYHHFVVDKMQCYPAEKVGI